MSCQPRMLIYTAIFGRPDRLLSPILHLPMDQICFTDMNFHGETGYKMVRLGFEYSNPRKAQRRVKIFWPEIFDDYDYSLYLDTPTELKADPTQFIDFLEEGSDILVFRHPDRTCLYDEASFCMAHHMVDEDLIDNQLRKYRSMECPENLGLYIGGVIFRRHTEEMRHFSELWWQEVRDFCGRDQVSLPFVIWQQNTKVSIFPEGGIRDSPWFNRPGHNRQSELFQRTWPEK